MKTFLLMLGAASMMGGEAAPAADACPVSDASGAAASSGHTRFDPLVLDLKGDGAAKLAPGACNHAINTKGTGAAGRVAAADHAINTKGTGASGRAGPGSATDCDDTDPNPLASRASAACAAGSSDPDEVCGDAVAAKGRLKVRVDPNMDGAIESRTAMAIKCKGTGAQ